MSPIRVGTDHRVQRAGGIGGAAAEFDGDCPVLQLKLTFSGRPTEAPAVGVEHLRIHEGGNQHDEGCNHHDEGRPLASSTFGSEYAVHALKV